MFTDEELNLIKALDDSHDRVNAIKALSSALPEMDEALRPEMENLMERLHKISDADYAAIDFDTTIDEG